MMKATQMDSTLATLNSTPAPPANTTPRHGGVFCYTTRIRHILRLRHGRQTKRNRWRLHRPPANGGQQLRRAADHRTAAGHCGWFGLQYRYWHEAGQGMDRLRLPQDRKSVV